MAVTAEELRALFRYDPDTGDFTRLVAMGRKAEVGRVAGKKAVRGNWVISVRCRTYSAHRLAWLYMTGAWPVNEIDHIDGNPLNNRFSNLREATSAENKQNRHVARKDNKHGLIGAYLHARNADGSAVWRARIQIGGKQKSLGLFKSPEAAQAAYLSAKRELHPFNTL
jgi:hypothetical protein